MRYDSSREALYRPQDQPPLDPALLAGQPDGLSAELARLAYYAFPPDAARLDEALAALGFVRRDYFEDAGRNTQAIALVDGTDHAVIAFRGTQADQWIDAVTDLTFLPVPWDRGGKVHRGFARAYDSADASVRRALAGWLAAHQPASLTVTGHSLGGALATLFASDHPMAELVTFGSPAVGDAAFAALFAGRAARRYCDCADLVTRLPPALIGFRHVGALRYIDRTGKVADEDPGSAAIAADVARAHAEYLPRTLQPLTNVMTRALADHAPINYVSGALGIRQG